MIEVKNLTKNYKSKKVFNNFNLNIDRGEFVAILGPNGVGKSTLLNIIAGIEDYQNGNINFKKEKYQIGYVFQNSRQALFPWLSVKENIGLQLKIEGVRKQTVEKIVNKTLLKYNLNIPLDVFPYTLSGGQAQLVSILQSIINKPDVLLLDEPFSSLDYQTALSMRLVLQKIWQSLNITIIFSTHNVIDAAMLANKVIFLGGMPTEIKEVITNSIDYPRALTDKNKNEILEMSVKIEKKFASLYLR